MRQYKVNLPFVLVAIMTDIDVRRHVSCAGELLINPCLNQLAASVVVEIHLFRIIGECSRNKGSVGCEILIICGGERDSLVWVW